MKEVDITLTINGSEVSAPEGATILEVAREQGIDIPTLCYCDDLAPQGLCRLCVVEVEGSRLLVGSCHTPITPGMVVQTHSEKVIATRKVLLELLLASHSGVCILCDKANICELRLIATEYEVGLSRFESKRRYYPIEDVSPYVHRDLSKCILCRRCVLICDEVVQAKVYAVGYRGFKSKIVVDCDQPLDKEVCRDCGKCIPVCPTGSLSKPVTAGEEKVGKPLIIKG